MPVPDNDEQFEHYLKEFRPLAVLETLALENKPEKGRRRLVWGAWAAACAACLVSAFLLLSHRANPTQPTGGSGSLQGRSQRAGSQVLTIGRANALLADAPSLKEAVDQLSFQPQPAPPTEGKQSALAALGREDLKL